MIKFSHIPLLFLIQFSGNPFFTKYITYTKFFLVAYTIIFSIFVFSKSSEISKNFIEKLVKIIFIIWLLTFLQYIFLGSISIAGVFAFCCKLILIFFTIIYYYKKEISFLETYVKIMSNCVIISIPFFLLNQFYFFGLDINHDYSKTLGFYTMRLAEPQFYDITRNSGYFWEPGAFAGYLILGLIFIVLINKSFSIVRFKKEYRIIVLGIISTFSTGAYLVMFTFFVISSIYNRASKFIKLIFFLIVILIINWSYTSFSFLQNKVNNQYVEAMSITMMDVSPTRMGSLIMDLQYIKSSPIIGNGLGKETRYRFHKWLEDENFGHGNGMSNFIAYWGIPLLFYWLYCAFRFIKSYLNFNNNKSLLIIFLLILLLQIEQFLLFPIFLSFFLLDNRYIYNNN